MNSILDQIRKGLDCKLYYLSLFVALCIPDICAALESETGDNNGEIGIKYKKWIDDNIVPLRPGKYGDQFTSDYIYQFRCSILHQGSTNNKKSEYLRILFLEPGETKINGLHSCIIGAKTDTKSLLIDVNEFCNDIIKATELWLNKNKENKNYIKNVEKVIKRYPKGINPVFGAPVIG